MGVDSSSFPNKLEFMEKNLERVISWINNCDQKASILLTLLGVIVTLVFTSDVFVYIENNIMSPFLTYLRTGEGTFSFLRTIISSLLLISLFSITLSLIHLLSTLSPNINYENIRKKEPKMVEKSNIFFGSISKMRYNDFNILVDDYYEDLRSQVYANSLICRKKFENYTKSLKWIFLALPSLFLSILLLLFI